MKSDEITYARMSSFLNLYGFSRNLAFVLAVGGVALIIRGSYSLLFAWHFDQRIALGIVALVASLGLFQRYLFFHRLYSMEALTTFDAVQRRPRSRARKSNKRRAEV